MTRITRLDPSNPHDLSPHIRATAYYVTPTGAVEDAPSDSDVSPQPIEWMVTEDRIEAKSFPETIAVDDCLLRESNTGRTLYRQKNKIIVDADNGYAEYAIARRDVYTLTYIAHRVYLREK